MSGGIKEAHILHVQLPLRKKFKHALHSRSQSDSIFLKLLLEDGTVGYGESLPREYVTGETPGSLIKSLKDIAKRRLLGYAPKDYKEVSSFIKSLDIEGATKCVLELALLDAYGRYFKSPISSIIGKRVNDTLFCSGVIHAGSLPDVITLSLAFKVFGMRFIKVKVGMENDIARLKIVRCILGKDANIRVDANCAWTPDEAVENINKMRKYNISAVEQPVEAGDYDGLKGVTDSVPEIIIADESICTIDDAERLAKDKACNMFNIRISKCGGILNSLKITGIARDNKIGIQLGCQVGESGILSAAGWHFAGISEDISFYEGSYGKYLLKEDVIKEDMTIQRRGKVRPIKGPGLGINVLDEVLGRYTVSKDVIS